MHTRKKIVPYTLLATSLALQVWLPGQMVFATGTLAGEGTEAAPFVINSRADLEQVGNDLQAWYKLGDNIDLSGSNWVPIGTYGNPFNGHFDGNHHKITGLTIKTAGQGGSDGFGLFGTLGNNGKLENFLLENVDVEVTNGQNVGGLVGINQGEVSNSQIAGSVKGAGFVGGLVGLLVGGQVSDGASQATVDGGDGIGGLVGSVINHTNQPSYVKNSHSSGTITGQMFVGGLLGKTFTTREGTEITNSYSTASVTGSTMVGGLLGANAAGTISQSFASGTVAGNFYVGGLLGTNEGNSDVSDSFATGEVKGVTDAHVHGGLVGKNSASINTSFAEVTMQPVPVSDVGGLIGLSEGAGVVYSSYFNKEIAQNNAQGQSEKLGTPVSAVDLRKKDTFEDWDFDTVWAMRKNNLPDLRFNFENFVPTVKNSTITGAQNTVYHFTAGDFTDQFTDGDGDALEAVRITSLPAKGTLKLDGSAVTQQQVIPSGDLATLTYTPADNDTSDSTFTWNGTDGFAYAASDATVTIKLTALNVAPIANNANISTKQNTPVNGTLTATDEDGDELTYSIVTNGTKGSAALNGTTKEFIYTPNQGQTGTDTFTFKANDGKADSNVATVTVTINVGSKAPVAVNGSYTTKQNAAVNGVLTATDEDGDVLTYAIVTNGTKGSGALNGTTKEFTYTPNPGASGTDAFTFKANDGTTDSNIATVTIQIQSAVQPPAYYPVQSVTVNKSSLAFQVGDAPHRLKAEIYPSYATNQQVSWKSSDPAVATVDETGLVTPRAAGEANITVTTNDGGKSATSRVTVEAAQKEIDHLSVSERNLWMQPNETRNIRVYAVYQDGSREDITKNDETTYRSSLKSKVDVAEGKVTTNSGTGVATLTVIFQEKRLRIPVTISKTKVEKLTFEKTDIALEPEESVELKVNALLFDGSKKDVSELATWSTEDDDIITLDENGKVTAIASGTATIQAVYGGVTAELAVEVTGEKQVKRLKVNKQTVTLAAKEEQQLRVTAYMTDGSKRDVTADSIWTSSDEQVATVKDGVITAIAPGETSIRGRYQDRLITVKVTVTE
ncbi:hypothetical protein EDM56_17780 [Brevibacillus fluminis]|uniref:BIG2 domain-containing protein n=1 Tax=Brevibacillus fluminis TaxID=511487 RepID=A0A3M8DCJ1_9BACL|nr:Ig-like domain-containing protein [Brevibacillus fluminis]RNB85850.1 hypothetical protein EDM56_17780 [Brevibacillus fluminis]